MPRTYIEKGGSLKVRGLQPLRAQVPPIGVSQQVRWAAEVGSEPSPFPPWALSDKRLLLSHTCLPRSCQVTGIRQDSSPGGDCDGNTMLSSNPTPP